MFCHQSHCRGVRVLLGIHRNSIHKLSLPSQIKRQAVDHKSDAQSKRLISWDTDWLFHVIDRVHRTSASGKVSPLFSADHCIEAKLAQDFLALDNVMFKHPTPYYQTLLCSQRHIGSAHPHS